VVATVGHLRDLPKSKMGVNLKSKFEVDYVIDETKKKIVKELVDLSKKAELILLASDPDREGEAISWHVKTILEEDLKKKSKKLNITRITFHEITKEAVEEAMKHNRYGFG